MANAFEPKTAIPLKPKAPPQEPPRAVRHSGDLTLPAPKPKRKQCSLYLSEEMMDKVRRIARRQGVTIGAVIEACVKVGLEQMGE